MKKINSLIKSSVEVFRLSKPLLLASVSLILAKIWRVFIALKLRIPTL